MAFQFPWTNLHELNLDWFLSKFKQFTNNYLETTATAESVPYTDAPSVTVTGGELDDDTDIVDPFTFNFKIPAGQPGAPGATGAPGAPGQDGFSPIATVTKNGSVATITITDANGTTTTTISDGEVTQAQLDTKAPVIIASAIGSTATFTDGIYNMPISSIIADITPVQSGSGDPAPDNIRPISGRTGVNVYQESAYDPTANPVISLSWQTEAGVVYGGNVNLATGVLTATHALFDMGNASGFTVDSNRPGIFKFTIPGRLPASASNGPSDITACSAYKAYNVAVTTNIDNYISGYWSYGGGVVFFRDTRFIGYTSAQIKTAVSGYMLVYKLATPLTYQLTAQQMTAVLSGTNCVWSDTGNTTVNYPADTKSYIEQLTQPAEDDMTANSTIANGKFFMVGNNLYRATTTISNGSQIIPGTNATALSLADALNLL